jgi:uncharacterized protein DUF6508
MKKNSQPTLQDLEELTAFLPRLYAQGFSPIDSWGGGEKHKDGSFSMSYPNYNSAVEEFFRLVSSAGWLDNEYNPEQAYQVLRDEHLVKTASLSQIKTMLTFCVRGERFSDGHWGTMIEKGYVRRLLERLNEIKSEHPRNENEE